MKKTKKPVGKALSINEIAKVSGGVGIPFGTCCRACRQSERPSNIDGQPFGLCCQACIQG